MSGFLSSRCTFYLNLCGLRRRTSAALQSQTDAMNSEVPLLRKQTAAGRRRRRMRGFICISCSHHVLKSPETHSAPLEPDWYQSKTQSQHPVTSPLMPV